MSDVLHRYHDDLDLSRHRPNDTVMARIECINHGAYGIVKHARTMAESQWICRYGNEWTMLGYRANQDQDINNAKFAHLSLSLAAEPAFALPAWHPSRVRRHSATAYATAEGFAMLTALAVS